MSATTTTIKRRTTKKVAAKKVAANAPSSKAKGTPWLGTDVANGSFLLLALVAILCSFGLMMVLSSSSVDALRTYGSSWVFFKRQIIWLALGAGVLWLTFRTDYRFWRRWSKPMIIACAVMLFLVLVPGVGLVVSGSRRWLGAGVLRLQPSEVAKFAILLFASDLLSRRAAHIANWKATTRPVILMFGVFLLLVMMQPDMGTTLVIGAITVAVLFVAGTPLGMMAKMLGGTVLGAFLLAVAEPYRRDRLLSFMHPFSDAGNTGYQVVQSLVGIGSGGITGVGLGASRAKWGFLPNAHTDFIFAIIAEELGLIGAVLVVGLFIGFAVLGVRTATRAPDRFGMLMAAGITAWVVFQAFVNIGAVIGILPVTGVPLPFLSQGGSSLVLLMAATGVLLNIARQGDMATPKKGDMATPKKGDMATPKKPVSVD